MKKYIQNSEIVATELDDSLMMMSIEFGKYFELNTVSKRIWEILEQLNSIDSIVTVLLEEYDVTKVQCEQEVRIHIEELLSKGIIIEK